MSPLHPRDIIWIVAGTRQEFDAYVNRKKSLGYDSSKYAYVFTTKQFLGLSDIKGFYIGSYKSRSDIDEIILAIQMRKSYTIICDESNNISNSISIGVVDKIT